jgi:hypothetical protein
MRLMKYYYCCCCCCQFNDIKHEERHRLRINPSTVIRYLREMWKNLRPHGHRQMGLAQRDRGAGHYLTAPITLRAHTNSLEADSQCWTKSCVNLIRIQILLSFLSIKSKRCCRLSSNFVVDVADQKWEPCMKPNLTCACRRPVHRTPLASDLSLNMNTTRYSTFLGNSSPWRCTMTSLIL